MAKTARRGITVAALSLFLALVIPASAWASVPGKVTGVKAAPKTSASVSVIWTKTSRATHYDVQRRASSSSTWVTVGHPTSSTLTAGTLAAAKTYYFRVRSGNSSGSGTWSAQAKVTLPPATPSMPKAVSLSSGLSLSWNSVKNATSYQVRWRLAGAAAWSYAPVVTGTSCTISGTPGGAYEFAVQAHGTGGWSAFSGTGKGTALPGTPTGLSAVQATGGNTVSWTAPLGRVTAYRLESGTATAWTVVSSSIPAASVSYWHASPSASIVRYRLTALAGSVAGASATVTLTLLPPVPPATPAQPSVTSLGSGIQVSWTAVPGASSYLLGSRPAGGSWSYAKTTAVSVLSTGTPGGRYEFCVQASGAGGTSGTSPVATATVLPGTPTALAAVAASGTTSVFWTAPTGRVTGYRLESGTASAWTVVAATLSADATSFSEPTASGIVSYRLTALADGLPGTSAVAAVAVTPPPFSTALGYPRLCVWWPNNDNQSVADRARYDWIEMQWYDSDHIAELRAANPSIILLGSNNARELNYSLTEYDLWTNRELRSASTDWLVTQVGTTLSAAINATTTTIPVGSTARFSKGEMVLVDHELMSVTAVGSSTLTVAARGIPEPAATHAAGARIAATVSLWSGALEFDVTASCPKVDVGDGNGPETWNQWNVQRAKNEMARAGWDGIMIDCNDGNVGWWVDGGYAQSLDFNRDNVADDPHAAVDPAWNAGMSAYDSLLRAGLGSKVIIAGNGAVRNYVLNGKNWENWPNDDTDPAVWKTVVFGPYGFPNASYLDWTTNGTSPNFSTIQTYEYDNSIPAGSGWTDPGNDYSGFAPAGFVPNYQKMRYGLATALMGNGYFSYELTTYGHACRALFWFDEYDNAGKQRGFLGQPTGAAAAVAGTANVYRRDYQGGIVLVNPDKVAHTVSLGGTFRKIKGTQAPTVNDGSLVTSVTLRPRDGIVLLRP